MTRRVLGLNRVPEQSLATNASLLSRVRASDDQVAWREFVDLYGPRIYGWCINRKLQPSDAEDVTQDVLIRIARQMQTFVYDPRQSFRGWLRRVTENAVIDYFRSRKQEGVGGPDPIATLENLVSRTELSKRLEEVFDLEMLQEAKLRVKSRIDARRWQAWELTAVQQTPSAEVAERLNMKIASVYSSRFQVQQLISQEVEQLSQGQQSAAQ